MSALLQLAGLRVRYGAAALLDGVDIELGAGELVLLAGPNGAGKTTLLRAATGLLVPDAGEVQLEGRAIGTWSRREIARRIAFVPQETQIPFPFSAGEVALMGRAPHLSWLGFEGRRDREIAEDALAQVGVAALVDRNVQTLSGGERQLVVVARALAQRAPILLLDEPTSHLDWARRVALLQLLRALADAGTAVLLVSHDLAAAAAVADRVILLAGGGVAASGPPLAALTPDAIRHAFGVEARWLETDRGQVLVPDASGPA